MNKELQEIIAQCERLESSAIKTVLATVVDVKGSSYRLPGARMLIGENGEIIGTVSGGCLEADILARMYRVLQSGVAEVFTYDTTIQENSIFSLNMGCRGRISILLERPDNEIIKFFRTLYISRVCGLAATLIECNSEDGFKVGSRLLLNAENLLSSNFTSEIQEKILPECLVALQEKQSKHLTTETGKFFLEFIAPTTSLMIFGTGSDAIPIAGIAKNLGWHVTIIDHRAAFANAERFPEVDDIIITRPENIAEKISIDENTVAVVITHNYEHDKNILHFLLNSNAFYIGALGPKRRTESILTELRETNQSFSASQLERLYAPIGLDIGADTPEAIALSIIAEIKSVLSNRKGGFLREKKGSIYNRNATA